MYIQNPPIHLQEQIKRAFGDLNIIEEIPQNTIWSRIKQLGV